MRRQTNLRIALLLGALALLSLLGNRSSFAQNGPAATSTLRPVSDNEVNRVSRGLYCPVCQNVPLEVCETAACERWRAQVRDLLAQGFTEPQVRQYFVERFGAQTVGTPTDPLTQVLTLVLPLALIVLIGGLVLFNLVLWRRRRPSITAVPAVPAVQGDDYRAQLEAEIKEQD